MMFGLRKRKYIEKGCMERETCQSYPIKVPSRVNSHGDVRPCIYNYHRFDNCDRESLFREQEKLSTTAESYSPINIEGKGIEDSPIEVELNINEHANESTSQSDEKIHETNALRTLENDNDIYISYAVMEDIHSDDQHVEKNTEENIENGEKNTESAVQNTENDKQISEVLEQSECSVNNGNLNSTPIYQGHSLTLFMSAVLIWTYALTHNITGSQLSDLLVLINVHCLSNISIYNDIKSFKKYFAGMKSPLVKHYYCSFCLMSVSENSEICPNTFCLRDLKVTGNLAYFIESPLKKQLLDLYKRDDFRKKLKYKQNRQKSKPNGIEDIYDGNIYKRLSMQGQPLSNPHNLSFSWNTDGVPVFKSSSVSIWPMYLLINELPYKERIKKSNMLFYGLWFGDTKPEMNLFCSPFLDSLKELEDDGLQVVVDNENIVVRGYLICGTADLPAKSTAMNMTQFNGDYSCSKCLQKGRTEKIGLRGHTHIFPYDKDNPVGPERKSQDCLNKGMEALQSKKPVHGIKGPSFLMGLKCYDYVKSTCNDYMHCVLLGITKKLTSLWFSSTSSTESFSLFKHLDTVDSRLTKIKPSYHITRKPRSISEHLKFWKASEFRSWLLFYSVPVLKDLMNPTYFFHYCAFVQSIWILNQDSILPSEIDNAYILLNYFVLMMEPLYGARYCTLNTHSLLHLPDCVRELGPLWVYSCFPYESLNGDLLKFFHGTQSVETQIVSAVNSHQILPDLISMLPDTIKNLSFVKYFIHTTKTSLGLRIDHNVFVVGGKQKVNLAMNEKVALHGFLGYEPQKLTFYARIMLRNILIHSKAYSRVQCRNSYTIMYLGKNNLICFGHVTFFAIHRHDDCFCSDICCCKNDAIAFVNVLEKTPASSLLDRSHKDFPEYLNMKLNYIHELKNTNKVEVVSLQRIVYLCIDVSFSDATGEYYVCEYPNTMECD